MAGAAGAGVRHGHLAGLFLDRGEELLQRVVGGILAHDDDLGIADERGDDGEVVIAQVAHAHGPVGAHGLRADEQRVAVGGLIIDVLAADAAGRAALIDDGDGLPELLLQQRGQRTAIDIRGAAGGVRDDHGDRTVGILGQRERGAQAQHESQENDTEFFHGMGPSFLCKIVSWANYSTIRRIIQALFVKSVDFFVTVISGFFPG